VNETLPAESDGGPRRTGRLIWPIAIIGAIVIHAACAGVALEYMRTDDDVPELGAPAIEIGVELAAPHLPPTDLPPGPDADASTASPPVVAQKEVIKESELPKARPTETDDPDRVVAPESLKKPKEEELKVAAVPTAPSQESVASEATATPRLEDTPEAPRSVAPVLGTGKSTQRARATWHMELVAHLDKHKRYPTDRSLKAAELLVELELDRMGHVVKAHILKGSGDPSFDQAALAMMQRADPVPAPPPLVADEGLTFTLPVVFRVPHHQHRHHH
jgi:periplasmic protein TonB